MNSTKLSAAREKKEKKGKGNIVVSHMHIGGKGERCGLSTSVGREGRGGKSSSFIRGWGKSRTPIEKTQFILSPKGKRGGGGEKGHLISRDEGKQAPAASNRYLPEYS